MTVVDIISKPKRFCSNCGSDKTSLITKGVGRKNPSEAWYRDGKGGWLCQHCYRYINSAKYDTIAANPKKKPLNDKWNAIYNPRIIIYKERHIILSESPRIGVCNICRSVVDEINAQTGKLCKYTNMHHEWYDDSNPLNGAIEICVAHHNAETRRIEGEEALKNGTGREIHCVCGYTWVYKGKCRYAKCAKCGGNNKTGL